MKTTIRNGALATAVLLGLSTPPMAQQSGDGLTGDVARMADAVGALVDRAGGPPFAVLPMKQADGRCTVLGGYFADEILIRLQAQANAGRTIIDRGRLAALIEKRGLGMSSLLDPETARALGEETGIQAVALGTITELGRKLRVSIRLVSTGNGRVLAATALTVARDELAVSLLGQPVAAGGFCSTGTATASAPVSDADAGTTPAGNMSGEPARTETTPATAGGDEIARLFNGRWEGFLRCGRSNWTLSYEIVARSKFDILADFRARGENQDLKLKSRIFFTGRDKPIRFDTQSEKRGIYDYTYKMTSERTLVGGVDTDRRCETMLNKVSE